MLINDDSAKLSESAKKDCCKLEGGMIGLAKTDLSKEHNILLGSALNRKINTSVIILLLHHRIEVSEWILILFPDLSPQNNTNLQ